MVDCFKLLGVFVSAAFNHSQHIAFILSVCNQLALFVENSQTKWFLC